MSFHLAPRNFYSLWGYYLFSYILIPYQHERLHACLQARLTYPYVSWCYLSEETINRPTLLVLIAALIMGLHHPDFSLHSEKSTVELVYFLTDIDTNLVLRIFETLSKSFTVTGTTLRYCTLRVEDYCGKDKDMPVSIITSGKVPLL